MLVPYRPWAGNSGSQYPAGIVVHWRGHAELGQTCTWETARTGQRAVKVLDLAFKVKNNLERILGREKVIEFFREAMETHPHPGTSQGPVNLSRCCQVMIDPVALAFETSHPKRVLPSYVRYLRRRAMEYFDLQGVPVRIWFRDRFQLRTDEELEAYLQGHRDGFEEWNKAERDEEEAALIPSVGEGKESW